MKGINWEADVIEADTASAAYQAGWQALLAGAERKANPHDSGLDKALWNKGWDSAAADMDYDAGWASRLSGCELDTSESESWQRGWQECDDWAASQI